MIWKPKVYKLPYFYMDDGDFLLLTPLDILTKDEAFICHNDFSNQFRRITNALDNDELRVAVNEFFRKNLPNLPNRKPRKEDIAFAIDATVQKYPDILDYYIQYKENTKDQAVKLSEEKVKKIQSELLSTLIEFYKYVASNSSFCNILPDSYQSALARTHYLKQVIEENDGYRIFYKDGKPIASEDTIQRIFRLTWFASPFDVNSEVNNGRGPADYKVSLGERDSTIVEFKLGSSTSLKNNLLNQTEIYKKASKSINDIKVILYYTTSEIAKVDRILKSINQEKAENVVVIDATKKVSASKVQENS